MKINKAYKLIFNEIIKGKITLKKINLDDDYVFITPDGYFGFVFCKKTIPFNLEMIAEATSKLDLFSAVKPENLCKKTKNLVVSNHFGYVNIFKSGDRKIYVNQKCLQCFEEHTEFYQEKDLRLIVAVEFGHVVGAVMPIRWMEGDDSD